MAGLANCRLWICQEFLSAWAPRRFCTGHVARGANLFGHEMVPDSSSWAGARDVSARAPSCEVMKRIFDQSLGCAILFKTATKHYYHYRHYYYYYPFRYFSDLRSFCESTFWCCFGSELVHGPSDALPPWSNERAPSPPHHPSRPSPGPAGVPPWSIWCTRLGLATCYLLLVPMLGLG